MTKLIQIKYLAQRNSNKNIVFFKDTTDYYEMAF